MEVEDVLKIAPVIGVAVGMAIHFRRQQRLAEVMGAKIRDALFGVESLSLPELVVRCGLRDGFYNRGKLINVLNPMVTSGELVQETPPEATIKTRLGLLRFRLSAKSPS